MSRRTTGGTHDFVDNDDLAYLDHKLGKHAKMGGRIRRRESTHSFFQSNPYRRTNKTYNKSYKPYLALAVLLAIMIAAYLYRGPLMEAFEKMPAEGVDLGELTEHAGEVFVPPCPTGYELVDENCVSIYLTGSADHNFGYLLSGEKGEVGITLYGGLNNYLAGKPRTYYCPPDCSQEQMELKQVFEEQQADELDRLVEAIQSKTDVKDDQARIAISLVQQIPYDWQGFESGNLTGRYPYEVLFDNKGVCGEKAKLMAYLLKGLGYGVVLMDYGTDHQVVGVKCPTEYSLNETGYCFVEAAAPAIPTDSKGDYVGLGALPEEPTSVIEVSEGASFESIGKEYKDAQDWNRIQGMGEVLPQGTWMLWNKLVKEYGIIIES